MADIDLGLTEVEARAWAARTDKLQVPEPAGHAARRRRRGAPRERRTVIRHALHRPGWTRRNRWGLLALPLALAAALAASSDRVKLYFWDEGLRQPQRAAQGDVAGLPATRYTRQRGRAPAQGEGAAGRRAAGGHAVAVDVAARSCRPARRRSRWSSAWRPTPDLPLSACRLAVRDAEGTRYDYLAELGSAQPFSPCVPPDAPGPNRALGELDEGRDTSDEPARPESVDGQPGDHAAGGRGGQRRRPLVGPAGLRRALRHLTLSVTWSSACPPRRHRRGRAPVDRRGEQAHRHRQPDARVTVATCGENASQVSSSCGRSGRGRGVEPVLQPGRGEERQPEDQHRRQAGDRELPDAAGEPVKRSRTSANTSPHKRRTGFGTAARIRQFPALRLGRRPTSRWP